MKFKAGDKVRIIGEKWDIKEFTGKETTIFKVGNAEEYLTEIDRNTWFVPSELELIEEEKEELKNVANADLHKQILNEMHDTYKRKNADYGNSFEEQFKEYGLLSVLIRLDDKMRRLKQLSKNEAQVKDESLRDTLMDLCNYSVMSVMELDKGSNDVK
jgi:transcriptional regulator of heat shock response